MDADGRQRLRDAVAARHSPAAKRTGVHAVRAGITVVVDAHGPSDGWLRDPVLRDVVVDERA
jgi:hypothetical protein